MTSWVLVMFLTYDRSGSFSTIPNLKSVDECRRVEQVIRDWKWHSRNIETKCVEVINAR